MTELLNSYTFEVKKIVYYSVTVGAENVTEAEEIASDPDYLGDEEDDVQLLEQDEYDVVELIDKEED